MDLKQMPQSPAAAAMICRTAIACLLLLSGLNAQTTVHTESLQTTSAALSVSASPHLESSQSSNTLEHSNTVASNTETFISKESSRTKTEGLVQATISGGNSTTTPSAASITSTTMRNDVAFTNSTTENNETNGNATTPNSLSTDSNLTSTAPSTAVMVSGGTLSTTSGPVKSSTETTADHTETTADHTETIANHTETIANHTETTANHTETIANRTETVANHTDMVTMATGNTPLQSTEASSGTFSYSISGNTDPTTPESEITLPTNAETESNKELHKALSTGSVAAITVIVIILVLLIFGGAAFWKIRHSSYGRLLEDQDYGSLGNYNNPLYDDS